jgi:hypothetical protein
LTDWQEEVAKQLQEKGKDGVLRNTFSTFTGGKVLEKYSFGGNGRIYLYFFQEVVFQQSQVFILTIKR